MNNKRVILFIFVLIYVTIFSLASIKQHNAYNTTLYDLGIFDQVVWNTAHGRFFESSIKGFNFLGDHFSPILLFIAPLYHIWSSAKVLLLIQTLMLAIGVFPVYLVAKREFKEGSIPLLFAFIYLAYPALGYLNMFDFHVIIISVPFLAWGFYFYKSQRWRLFYLCIVGALLCKEEIGLVVASLGLFIWITDRDFRRGGGLFALGLVYFIVVLFFIIPKIGQNQYLYTVRYSHLGADIWEIVKTVFLHPIYSIKVSYALRKLVNFIFIFLALGFTPFFSPAYLLIILPTLVYSYLSQYTIQFDMRYQYTAPIIPFLIFASVYGTKNILSWIKPIIWKKVFLGFFLTIVISASIVQVIIPLRIKPFTPRTSYTSIIEAAKFIPRHASLSVGNSLGAHFSQRRYIKEYTADKEPSEEFVFVDLNRDFVWTKDKESFFESIHEIIQNKIYGVVYFNNGILLLQKGVNNSKANKVLLYLQNHPDSNMPPENRVRLFLKKLFIQ